MVNNSSNSSNTAKKSREELNKDLILAQTSGNRDEAENIIKQLKAIDNPTKEKTFVEGFDDKLKEIKKKINDKKIKPEDLQEELKKFLKNDVNRYRKNIDSNVKSIEDSKQKEIERLQAQLNGVLSDEPSLKDYFSFERRRFASLRKHFDHLRTDDKAHYPKNVLIYAMTLTKGRKLFGVRQAIKRGRVKLARKRESDNIKDQIKELEDILKVKPDDSAQRKVTKELISEQIRKAKEAYVEQVKQKVL